ncbi:Na/Pi symporter [Cytophagales bacterium LB-30]|uniref:Na/Pi symporter n=1 Tax=Shiella aurantiaca TaxID=3058365 RepID=A0ABT8F649_9BACT|nr:Na/Pi symporter [Shiella aurantiaca]MDN4165729.1 Na/Pi symporter [Shiella aurantiaca]
MSQQKTISSVNPPKKLITQLASIAIALVFFFWAIDLMGTSFKNLGQTAAESLVLATSNPFVGLFIGLLITAIIQSSSTTTAIVVAVVAAGSLRLSDAVPIILGANIGTTLTSTIVSLGFITKPRAYRKALSAGIVHDFFNVLVVLLLFPLEYYYGFLSDLSSDIAAYLKSWNGAEFIPDLFSSSLFHTGFNEYLVEKVNNIFITIVLSFVILFASIKVLSNVIYALLIGESRDKFQSFLFKNTYKSFAWGMGLTAAVQSSSVTTSLVVPLVANSKISLRQAFNFVLGANIGTTITALIASLFKSEAAIAIAITHLLFNTIGVLIFLPFPVLRKIPVYLASKFSRIALSYRLIGFVYILFTFFIMPFMLIYFNKEQSTVKEITYVRSYADKKTDTTFAIFKSDQEERLKKWVVYANLEGSDPKEEPSNIYEIYQKGNVLFIQDKYFLLNKVGSCWDGEDALGRYKMCVDTILPQYRVQQLQFDSVWQYTKHYANAPLADSVQVQYWVSRSEQMVLQIEKTDKQGSVLYQEQINSFKKTTD